MMQDGEDFCSSPTKRKMSVLCNESWSSGLLLFYFIRGRLVAGEGCADIDMRIPRYLLENEDFQILWVQVESKVLKKWWSPLVKIIGDLQLPDIVFPRGNLFPEDLVAKHDLKGWNSIVRPTYWKSKPSQNKGPSCIWGILESYRNRSYSHRKTDSLIENVIMINALNLHKFVLIHLFFI